MQELINLFLVYLFPSFILMSAMIYGWHKLLDKKIDFKNHKLYITLACAMMISIINFIITEKFIRILTITVFVAILLYYLFKENVHKTILTAIFHQMIIFISEFLYVIVLTTLFSDIAEKIIKSLFGSILVNFIVAAISILIVRSKIVLRFFNYILKITEKIKLYQLILFCLIAILFLNIFVISAYHNIDFKNWVSINIVLTLVLFTIVLYSLKTQNKFNKVSDKYNIAIKSLNDYENMMTKYRIANHENKNLLLTIRAMILNKEKDIPKFIDTMIEDKYEDDEKLLFNMAVIPSGGLRATIYSEILKIKDNNINYSLDIDKKLRTIDLIELDTDTIVDICKIIGVFIDNAIDEVKRLTTKNIEISLYLENKNLYIKVSNNYKGQIDINRISEEGYTTKGKNHGYGLSLVKEIVNNNKLFENKIEISKDTFGQILVIKLKNHIN